MLLNEPTVERWRDELRRLLAGARDSEVAALGSIEEYVERQLRDSADRADAQGAFDLALDNQAIAWQVPRRASPYYVAGILQLICAFTPPAGFSKAFELVERWLGRTADRATAEEADAAFVALTALSRYYRTPPPNAHRDKTYRKYTTLLRSALSDVELGALALRQLLELGEFEPSSDEATQAIISDVAKLNAAVDFAVLPPAPWNKEHLSAVLSACIAAGKEELFDQFCARIEWHDAAVLPETNWIMVSPADGVRLYIEPDPALADQYGTLRWDKSREAGFEVWEQ